MRYLSLRALSAVVKLSCFLSMCAVATICSAQVTAIRAGRVIDPASDAVLPNQVILVENGKISAVGSNLAIPAGAAVVDLSSRTVLPGLIDAHTHLCANIDPKWDLGDFWIYAVQRRNGFRAILGAAYARQMLESGFTSVRDMGNAGDYADMDLAKAIEFGIVPGPTIIAAGRIIAPFGGQFWDFPADRKMLDSPEYYFADSRDEMRKAVRENIYFGAKVIKVVVDSKKYIYSVDDLKFIVDEAAAAGLKVAAHAQTARGAHSAVAAGVASVEHAWNISDDDLALAKKNGVVLVTTDFTVRSLVANGMSEADARKTHEKYVERLRRVYRAGVPVVFGTDLMVEAEGRTRGQLALEYIDSFVEAGVPPSVVLKAMTSDAAKLLGIGSQRGAIKPGMAADLIAVEGDPLRDLHALQGALFVMKDGKVVRSSLANAR